MKTLPTKLRLTSRALDTLCALPPEKRARRYWDTEFPGFYLQFSKIGTPSFMLRYTKPDGADGEVSLGLAQRVPVEGARTAAREKMAALTLNGIDPVADRRRRRAEAQQPKYETFGDLAEAFLEKLTKNRKNYRRCEEDFTLRRYVLPALGRVSFEKITKQTIKDLVHQIKADVAARRQRKGANGKTTANSSHQAIRRVYQWAVDSEITLRNPAAFPCMFPESLNVRFDRLNEERFADFWNAAIAGSARGFGWKAGPLAMLIYMVTLQRPIDVARAKRSHFNFETKMWSIPDDETKTDVWYFIPLSDVAIVLIQHAFRLSESEYLFPSDRAKAPHMDEAGMTQNWARYRRALLKAGKIPDPDIELYDCRRFGRTQIQYKLKFDARVAEAVINHAPSKSMATRYDVRDLGPDVRLALQGWGTEVLTMVGIDISVLEDIT